MHSLKAILIIILLSISPSAYSEETNKDLQVEFNQTKYSLNKFEKIYPNHHFFGVYERALAYTGGIKLHLFPNFKFLSVLWCDVCMDQVKAKGTFTFKNGKIHFSYDYIDEKELGKLTELNVYYGRTYNENYVSGFLPILLNEKELQNLKKDKSSYEYWHRTTTYNDWELIYNSLLEPNNL